MTSWKISQVPFSECSATTFMITTSIITIAAAVTRTTWITITMANTSFLDDDNDDKDQDEGEGTERLSNVSILFTSFLFFRFLLRDFVEIQLNNNYLKKTDATKLNSNYRRKNEAQNIIKEKSS